MQKSKFPKMHHYVGIWQIVSHIGDGSTKLKFGTKVIANALNRIFENFYQCCRDNNFHVVVYVVQTVE